MKILFICTAHNSLSQRLFLSLSETHTVTIEYALSNEIMITAVQLAQPDLIICPFLITHIPKEIYESYMTLIIHPGPPGDAGPSALDWLLIGDDGNTEDPEILLKELDEGPGGKGRPFWGVSVIQAVEEFDAGPVWAFEQFALDIDNPSLTKSSLYRGEVTRAAVRATSTAIGRLVGAAAKADLETNTVPVYISSLFAHHNDGTQLQKISPRLKADPKYGQLCSGAYKPFLGGTTYVRPLLKPAQRDFDVKKHTAQQISRRIRCSDSQPGTLTKLFGPNLYVYGGIIDDCVGEYMQDRAPGTIFATRDEAICIATCDGRGIWLTRIRRLKRKIDTALWPKVPAVSGLVELGILTEQQAQDLDWALPSDYTLVPHSTFQEIWINFVAKSSGTVAYMYFNFYNGAMSTAQCSHVVSALEYVLHRHSTHTPIDALVLMGGAYFSNGIALNVIEASADPAKESWLNINGIDDVVQRLLSDFPSRNILTVAGVRGNAAAGGVALAASCDLVLAGEDVVLNPAYRAVGLHGSEYHSISYFGRCGKTGAKKILRDMVPISPKGAKNIGLVDTVLGGTDEVLDKRIRTHVEDLLSSYRKIRVLWKERTDLSIGALTKARAEELHEMALDFYSARSVRYNSRRFDFVRKVKAVKTPLRFASHRRVNEACLDEEEQDAFDDIGQYLKPKGMEVLDLEKKTNSVKTLETGPKPDNAVGLMNNGKSDVIFSCYYTPALACV